MREERRKRRKRQQIITLVVLSLIHIFDEAYTLIAPYVEKDPTKFCTAEEFETGAAALRTFCQLRSEARCV